MRLTLRTMLAYLDDVLDPADKDELGKKIESSEFAQDLVHRTRDTMRRLRLSAPQVVGAGMGLDPNTVAEYLDNALPPDSMGDFERICLESDMHLAEVASCHHVLTMVLGQPADVDPAAKQRMYSIPTEAAERKRLRVEAAHSHAASGAAPRAASVPSSPLAAAPMHVPAKAVEIPEYLRTTGWSRYRGLLLGLAALLLVAATVYFLGGLNQWFGRPTNTTTAMLNNVDPADLPPASTLESPAAAPENITDPSMHRSPAFPATPEITPPMQTSPLSPPAQEGTASAIASTDRATDNGAAGTSVEATPEMPAPAADSVNPYAVRPTPDSPPFAAIPEVPLVPEPPVAGSEITSGTPELSSDPTAVLSDPPVADSQAAMEVGPDGTVTIRELDTVDRGAGAAPELNATDVEVGTPKVTELGTYLGGKTVLLRHDEEKGGWFRVTPRSAVAIGERLLALPEFRPKISLAAGLNVDIAGGTLVTMGTASGGTAGELPALAADAPAIDVVYGRIVLTNTSNDERQIRLTLGPTIGNARLARNATLAVEVERKYVPGLDPRTAAAPVIARLYVPEGGVVWQDASGEQAIAKPSEWTIADGAAREIVDSKSLPEWIDQERTSETSGPLYQLYAAPEIEGALVSDQPVDVQLLELFQGSKRREVKSLAARSGIHVGLFVPFVEALRDSGQKANWSTHIQALRSAMALGPESAEKIWRTLVEQRGETAAADMYEMLCGYDADQVGRTPDQWKTGAIARLIDWLDEESLDYRVLAMHDLREITGKQYMTNPAGRLEERARNIRVWRSRLESGDLPPKGSE